MNDMLEAAEINQRVYVALFTLENALRELIIEKLTTVYGAHWYNQALPGSKQAPKPRSDAPLDILGKYREARTYQRGTPWTQNVPHHPIYYLDFPDLATIIERKTNWDAAFKGIFRRKEIIISSLRELEPIRNKVAHNRRATSTDLQIAESTLNKLSSYVGEEYLLRLMDRFTTFEELPEMIHKLRLEAKRSIDKCLTYEQLGALKTWIDTKNEWWFDSEYLEHDITTIREFFELLEGYMLLSRGRGSGHKIENWVAGNSLADRYTKAEKQLEAILKDFSHE